jgi:hypothetical protein
MVALWLSIIVPNAKVQAMRAIPPRAVWKAGKLTGLCLIFRQDALKI